MPTLILRSMYLLLSLLINCSVTIAGEISVEPTPEEVLAQFEAIKEAVIDLNITLYDIEDEILDANKDDVLLLVANNMSSTVIPQMISYSIDNQHPFEHYYSDLQVLALEKGGVHPLQKLNLEVGYHTLVIKLQYRIGSTPPKLIERQYAFDKKITPKYIEIVIAEDSEAGTPLLKIDSWE